MEWLGRPYIAAYPLKNEMTVEDATKERNHHQLYGVHEISELVGGKYNEAAQTEMVSQYILDAINVHSPLRTYFAQVGEANRDIYRDKVFQALRRIASMLMAPPDATPHSPSQLQKCRQMLLNFRLNLSQ